MSLKPASDDEPMSEEWGRQIHRIYGEDTPYNPSERRPTLGEMRAMIDQVWSEAGL
jgi:hypothetical protein